jgi:DNA-binding winged helix-turn-helix (wHTH) protein/tetratricopeptide (TPR) repeat protein
MAGTEIYRFGGFTLEVAERRLSKDGCAIALAPKAFDLLVALVTRAGRLVGKQDLLESLWPHVFVEEGILTVHVSVLRKALGDTRRPARFIETVTRRGYRFVAPVADAGAVVTQPSRHAPVPGGWSPVAARSSPEVYELCGRGREHLQVASAVDVPKAIDAFRAAIELDPWYGPAHAGLALAYCAQAAMRVAPPHDAYRDARAAALRALAMDAQSADAHVALGTVLFFGEWDWPGAERSLTRALEMNPGHVQGYLMYGRLLDTLGRHQEALEMKSRALQCDPASPLVLVQLALSYWNQRRYDDAMVWAAKALDVDPRHLMAREFLVGAYMNKGDFDRYMEETVKHVESFGMTGDAVRPIEHAYRSGGWTAVGRCCLELSETNAPAFQLAVLSTLAGDIDAAFRHLDRAILERDPSLVDLAVAPQWDRLRSDARFAERVARMGLSCAVHD